MTPNSWARWAVSPSPTRRIHLYEVTYKSDFDAAHRLYEYEGKCARLHGHTWEVEVSVACGKLDQRGMVCDFFDLKRGLAEVLAPFDHTVINEVEPFDRLSPTSENLARFIFEGMAAVIADKLPDDASIASVRVWENRASSAIYRASE